jgi:hypothetical protein
MGKEKMPENSQWPACSVRNSLLLALAGHMALLAVAGLNLEALAGMKGCTWTLSMAIEVLPAVCRLGRGEFSKMWRPAFGSVGGTRKKKRKEEWGRHEAKLSTHRPWMTLTPLAV